MRGPSKRFRKPLTIVFGVILLAAAPFAIKHLVARAEYASDAATLPAETARARELGLALTWDDLTPSWGGTDENAAPLYEKAFAETKLLSPSTRLNLFPQAPSGPGRLKELRVGLEGASNALGLLEQAAARPRCWFDLRRVPGETGIGFPRASSFREAVKLVCARAEYQSHSGQLDAALGSLLVAAAIARHAGDESDLIGWLVKTACDSIVLKAFNNTLVPDQMTPGRQAQAMRVLDALGSPNPLSAYRCDLVSRLTIYDEIRYAVQHEAERSKPPLWEQVQEWWTGVRRAMSGLEPEGFDISAFLPRLQSPATVEQAYQARELHRWNAFYEVARNHAEDPVAVRKDLAALQSALEGGRHRVDRAARVFSYVTEGVGESFHRQVAKRALAEQALAVMGYRSRTGHWPAALVDAGKVTMDPFDGKPLRYIRRADGFVVYSIGVDGKDDRGGKGDEVFAIPVR